MTAKLSKRKRMPIRKVDPPTKQVKQALLAPVKWPAGIVVLALTFLAYSSALRFQWVYDDVEQIVNNSHVQSWSFLSDYFTKSLWSQGSSYQVRFYRPLFLLWLRVNDALFGLNVAYWHLTTIAAHLLATLLIFILVHILLRNWVPAFLSALFFGLHPIHVEVAAWISAASEALLASALIASLVCYAEGASRRNNWWVAGSLTGYASGLLLKETAMVFPVVIFTFEWLWFEHKENTRRTWFALVQTLPFLALTVVYLIVRWTVLNGIVTAGSPIGIKTLVLTLPSLLLFYGRLLVWPTELSAFYDIPLVEQPSLSSFVFPGLAVVSAGFFLVLLCLKAWKAGNAVENARAESRLVILASVWMVLFLLPALYLPALQIGAFVQDRYLYLPSVGFLILLSLGLSRFGRTSGRFLEVPWAHVMPALVLASIMAVGIEMQSRIWENNLTLFTRAIERSPKNRVAQHDLAAALVDAHRYSEAIKLLQKLLSEDPNDPADNNNLGQAYLDIGDRIHAEVFLARYCQLQPTANRLYQLGAVRFNLGRFDAAEQAFREAIAMNPNGLGYHSGLGLALERLGKPDLAIGAFQQELTVNPDDTTSRREVSRLTISEKQ